MISVLEVTRDLVNGKIIERIDDVFDLALWSCDCELLAIKDFRKTFRFDGLCGPIPITIRHKQPNSAGFE